MQANTLSVVDTEDPIIASDGQVYERQNIIKWISKKVRSPFSRQPLSISDLKSDQHLKYLAAQKKDSLVTPKKPILSSYNRHMTYMCAGYICLLICIALGLCIFLNINRLGNSPSG